MGAALLLRIGFALLISGTYDYDEFVILLLSRDFARGQVPYHDFMFFHPPGVLILYHWLEPLTSWWWPLARALPVLVDTATAGLVWLVAGKVLGTRQALYAGLLYAVSPLALLSAVRVDQDVFVTFFGMLGLALLVLRPSRAAALLAGIFLALAIWMKYPAALFLPVYVLAAPRRTLIWLPAALVTGLALLIPFHAELHQLYRDTVTFQKSRWLMVPQQRFETVLLYWLGVNCLALPGLFQRGPLWIKGGFLVGGVFVVSSQVYYHYFVPIVPFAALLASPFVAGLVPDVRRLLPLGAALVIAWTGIIDLGGQSPLYITAARLADIGPTIHLIDRTTTPKQPILADRYEYAYLARRPALAHYFWNIGVLVGARYLEQRLPPAGDVVMSYGASSGFPAGFTTYLDSHYRRVQTPANTVWLLSRSP